MCLSLSKGKRRKVSVKEVRVAIIGGGMISHRHMVIYSNIQRRAAELGFTAKVCFVGEKMSRAGLAERYGLDEKDTIRIRDFLSATI